MEATQDDPSKRLNRTGGRPRKAEGDRAELNLTIWVTPAEYERIRADYRVHTVGSQVALSRYLKEKLLLNRDGVGETATNILRDYYVTLEDVAHRLRTIAEQDDLSAKPNRCAGDTALRATARRSNEGVGTGLEAHESGKPKDRIVEIAPVLVQISSGLTQLADFLYGTKAAGSQAGSGPPDDHATW